MTEADYQQFMVDLAAGRKEIEFHAAGAANLFLRASPRRLRAETGCAVLWPCLVTRAIVYALTPLLLVAAGWAGYWWLGWAGVYLAAPAWLLIALVRWGFGRHLPRVRSVSWMTLIVLGAGAACCLRGAGMLYWTALATVFPLHYVLFAVPLNEATKCVARNKDALAYFREISRDTPTPVLTVTELEALEEQDEPTVEEA